MSLDPRLLVIGARWEAIRDEALALIRSTGEASAATSMTLPLFPVGPDQRSFADAAPISTRVSRHVVGIRAAAFSILAPGERSFPGSELHGLQTCVLCLQGGGASHIVVDGERLELADGTMTVFSAAAPRVMVNEGTAARIALWLLFDPVVAQGAAGADSAEKALARRVIWEILAGGRIASAAELMAPKPAASLTFLAAVLHRSFPDLELEIDHLVAEGSTVACAWRATGTQTESFYNVPATGARMTWGGAAFLVIAGGRVTGLTMTWDIFGLMQRLRAALAEQPFLPRWVPVDSGS